MRQACSTTFRSSRTLPGQSRRRSSASASLVRPALAHARAASGFSLLIWSSSVEDHHPHGIL